ncbi:MAG: hypothetical protein QM764_21205 [Chitinophagaceae bacterium]
MKREGTVFFREKLAGTVWQDDPPLPERTAIASDKLTDRQYCHLLLQ